MRGLFQLPAAIKKLWHLLLEDCTKRDASKAECKRLFGKPRQRRQQKHHQVHLQKVSAF